MFLSPLITLKVAHIHVALANSLFISETKTSHVHDLMTAIKILIRSSYNQSDWQDSIVH